MTAFLRFNLTSLTTLFLVSFTSVTNETRTITFNIDTTIDVNPFKKLIGEWTLKNDLWETTFGGVYNSQKISNVIVTAEEINTKNSILFVEDLRILQAHVLWIYNFKTQEVHHLSNSTINSSATGKGKFKQNGDLELKLYFEQDCDSCYRTYAYQWKGENEFFFKATYYKENIPTGDFYSGTFIRKGQ